MWHNGISLERNIVDRISAIVRRSRNIWAFFCFSYVAVFAVPAVKSALIYRGDIPFILILVLVFFGLGMLVCITHNRYLNILKRGTFLWTDDIVLHKSIGTRYRSPSVSGRQTYHVHQMVFAFHHGDSIIAIEYFPEKQNERFHYPFAYKVK